MINTQHTKIILIGTLALCIIIILGIVMILLNSFQSPQTTTSTTFPTPTPNTISPGSKNDSKTYQLSPLEKTVIGKTTDKQIEKESTILAKTKQEDTTVYIIKADQPEKTDEIRTRNGVVIFERTTTETAAATPPQVSSILSTYGQPEEILDKVGEGFYMSAYLYPSQGFAIYANKYTQSIYKIDRFLKTTLLEYKKEYGTLLSPAPEMPKEYFKR